MKFLTALFEATRHYLLHFGAALIFAIILNNFLPINFLFLLVATLSVDLDHLFSLKKNQRFEKVVKETESHDDLTEKIDKDVKYYWSSEKGFNKLYLHNFPATALFLILFLVFALQQNIYLYSIFLGLLIHQAVDVVGDLIRWKNVKNWERL